ncbi:MAG: LytTR family DNA-binding domain-containing protein [Saprospiraceae bacterium]|nr:LytTR family DNA-binding domain-containing protein [Saprospiraceae bacterium]
MKQNAYSVNDQLHTGARIIPLGCPPHAEPFPHRRSERTLACPTSEGIYLVQVDQIIHCVADGNYVRIGYGEGKELLLSKTLGSIAVKLPASQFVRVHQSHLVNLAKIACVRSDAVVLTNGTCVPVSRRARVELKTIIQSCSL